MTVVVFTGPTLAAREARQLLRAQFRPPAACGDVYRAACRKPTAIGLIDGFFETRPAVWHKEILWAMAQGIPVYGSASMGAMRAAELQPYGMRGVGRIFEAFCSGTLEDDDEVAVAHGPRELGFRPLSDAMVNIRATLERAASECVIKPRSAERLVQAAKARFYRDRSFADLLQRARRLGLPRTEIVSLANWLPRGEVNQKRADALEMLQVIMRDIRPGLTPQPVTYRFPHTQAWDAFLVEHQR